MGQAGRVDPRLLDLRCGARKSAEEGIVGATAEV